MMPEKIVSPKIYLLIFGALFVFTLATTGIAFIDLGPFNTVVALLIAATKASLVVLFFMHVKYQNRLTAIFVISGFAWLAIMMILSSSDYLTRGWLPAPRGLPPF